MAGGYVLGLAQGTVPGGHVIVEPLARRGGGLVDIAGQGGVVFIAALQRQGVGGLVEGDLVFRAVSGRDHQPVAGIDPFQPHHVVRIEVEAGDVVARAVVDQRGPGGPRGDSGRRLGELEIDGAIGVGPDHPAVGPVVEVVFNPSLPGSGDDGSGGGFGGGDDPNFAGLLIARLDQDVAAVGRNAQAQEHTFVRFLID